MEGKSAAHQKPCVRGKYDVDRFATKYSDPRRSVYLPVIRSIIRNVWGVRFPRSQSRPNGTGRRHRSPLASPCFAQQRINGGANRRDGAGASSAVTGVGRRTFTASIAGVGPRTDSAEETAQDSSTLRTNYDADAAPSFRSSEASDQERAGCGKVCRRTDVIGPSRVFQTTWIDTDNKCLPHASEGFGNHGHLEEVC